ncbi:HepT-like ribonuclease domain-containing protein [Rhizobium sp. SL42]|uniref:HepT-like ribonuclease domain-containing protein n=1 Tax=Rhizobium sp. SL42 TaxID=2806346 RepID=UPI0030199719
MFPAHDWLAIRNLGDVLRHDYHGVLDSVIWATLILRLPPLLQDLEGFLAMYPEEQETLSRLNV